MRLKDVMAWASKLGTEAQLNLAIASTARVFAAFLDEHEISPDDLQTIIQENRPIILQAVAEIPIEDLAAIRTAFSRVAKEMRRSHTAPNGRTWHPYKAVLQEEVLARDHAEHVRILEQHADWYKAAMDAAMDFVFGRLP